MRLLTYSISAFTGLLAAVVFAAALSKWNSPAITEAGRPTGAKSETKPADLTKPTSLPPRPWETTSPPPPLKYKDLDAVGLAKLLGGPDVVAVLNEADRFTSVLLRVPMPRTSDPAKYVASTPEVELDRETATSIRAALFDPAQNRQVDAAKGCAPIYGWKVSIFAGDRRVDFYFCFDCGIVTVQLQGTTVGGSHFDHVADELKRLRDTISHATSEPESPVTPLPPIPAAP